MFWFFSSWVSLNSALICGCCVLCSDGFIIWVLSIIVNLSKGCRPSLEGFFWLSVICFAFRAEPLNRFVQMGVVYFVKQDFAYFTAESVVPWFTFVTSHCLTFLRHLLLTNRAEWLWLRWARLCVILAHWCGAIVQLLFKLLFKLCYVSPFWLSLGYWFELKPFFKVFTIFFR